VLAAGGDDYGNLDLHSPTNLTPTPSPAQRARPFSGRMTRPEYLRSTSEVSEAIGTTPAEGTGTEVASTPGRRTAVAGLSASIKHEGRSHTMPNVKQDAEEASRYKV